MRARKMMISAVTALTLGAGVSQVQAAAPTCVTIESETGCNPVVSDEYGDTAMGTGALNASTGGYTGGYSNTASGEGALKSTTSGYFNTASGFEALYSNTTGNNNTASGVEALNSNTTGLFNTASGVWALYYNTTGSGNTAPGFSALYTNTTGSNNTGVGYQALYSSTTANYTTAIGYQALYKSQSGLGNIGVGPFAGQNIVTGELNIDIGSWGTVDESNTIRIGITGYHDHTYMAGIYNSTGLTGLPVIITSSGQLGVGPVSSERYKTGIATMGSATARLSKLRPVTFKLKSDTSGTVQYGLVAEEVAKVYPELVVRNENGRIDGVRYDELAPMLLNEMQKEQTTVATLVAQHEADAAKIASLEQQLIGIQAALAKLEPKDHLVAQR